MRWFIYTLFLVMTSVFLISNLSFAQPTIHGELSGILEPGTYIVDGHCLIAAHDTLIIMPGTTFLHAAFYYWDIAGTFIALGTEDGPIRFLAMNPQWNYRWLGLYFHPGSENGSELRWCEFEYCRSVGSPNYYGGAISLDYVSVPIKYCTFANCEARFGGAIYADHSDSLVIDSCLIIQSYAENGGGIFLEDCNNTLIRHCYIGLCDSDGI